MRQIITSALVILFAFNVFGQDEKLHELIRQGIEFHDQGKYDGAIAKYKAALEIDKKSTIANYELSYTYFVTKKYNEAIKHSKIVINQNTENQHESYVILVVV